MKPVSISQDQFTDEVINSNIPVLVDFWADWCQPCKQLGGMLEKIGERRNGHSKIVKIDTMQANELASNLGISTLPTVIMYKNGRVVDSIVGLRKEKEYEALLDSAEGL